MSYHLFDAFRGVFEGQAYRHRRSNLGDRVAMSLYEDLYRLGRSAKYVRRVDAGISVLSTKNTRQGIRARRGDGSFGGAVPNTTVVQDSGYIVRRGEIATIEIGIEVKIIMKAMMKQIDRVKSALKAQVEHFQSHGGDPICVGIVGINSALSELIELHIARRTRVIANIALTEGSTSTRQMKLMKRKSGCANLQTRYLMSSLF